MFEGSRDGKDVAPMIDRPNALTSRIDAAGPAVENRIRRPAVPQFGHHRHEFVATGVAIGVAYCSGAAIILGRGCKPGGHDVPGRAAVADVINGRELAREVVRLGVGRRRGGDQPNPAGCRGERRQHGNRFEPGARCLGHIAAESQLVGEKDGIEQSGLGSLRQIHIIPDIGQRQRRRRRMAPRCLVMAPTVNEQVQMQLPLHGPVLAT